MADGTGDPVKPFLIPKSHSHPQSEEGDHQSSTVFFQREEFSWLPRYCRHLTSKRAGCQQKVRNGFTGREPDWTCRENHNIRYPHIVANQYISWDSVAYCLSERTKLNLLKLHVCSTMQTKMSVWIPST